MDRTNSFIPIRHHARAENNLRELLDRHQTEDRRQQLYADIAATVLAVAAIAFYWLASH